MPAAALALVLVEKRPEDAIDKRRRLTDDEDEDDDDQHDGEILLLLLLVMTGRRPRNSAHLPPLSTSLLQCRDQLGVEKCQKEQRTSHHHDKVEDVVVDHAEDAVFPDVGEEMHRRDEATGAV